MAIGVVITAISTMFSGFSMWTGSSFVDGLLVLAIGAIGVLVYGGFLYLGLGIYYNTKRTAEGVGGPATPAE